MQKSEVNSQSAIAAGGIYVADIPSAQAIIAQTRVQFVISRCKFRSLYLSEASGVERYSRIIIGQSYKRHRPCP